MRYGILLLVLLGTALSGGSDGPTDLGYREDTIGWEYPRDECTDGTLQYNHDGSVENGYAWSYGWMPPYYGAFAEAFDLGAGNVVCGAYWLTQIGYWYGHPMDVYIWDGGVTRDPGEVLCLVHDVVPYNIPIWPEYGQNDFEVDYCVGGEFTLGWWADFSEQMAEWYMCADENGPGGYPWVYVMPGIGYETGWNHAGVVFGGCRSLFIGPYFDDGPTPPVSETWGTIKALFR